MSIYEKLEECKKETEETEEKIKNDEELLEDEEYDYIGYQE